MLFALLVSTVLGVAVLTLGPGGPLAPGPALAATGGETGPPGDDLEDEVEEVEEEGGAGIQGSILRDGEPLPDVIITVEGEGFAGEVETGAEGEYLIEVPGPGEYTVTVVVDSLPDDAVLRNPERNPLTVEVSAGNVRAALFPIGEGERQVTGFAEQALERLVYGLAFGLLLALAALGLSLIFGTTGLTNFSHGEIVTLGGFSAFVVNTSLGVPVLLAAVMAALVCAAAGWLVDRGLWLPLRRRGTGLISMMIVSIGLSLLVRYAFLYQFGGGTNRLNAGWLSAAVQIGPARLTRLDLVSMLICLVALVLIGLVLLRTRLGKATRAVADNPDLAAASGIDVERVIRLVWVFGAGLAGLAGSLFASYQGGVAWDTGFRLLLLIFAAVVLGGLGTAFGALIGALVVGVFVEMSTLVIPSELQNVGGLAILIVVLLVRPQGILGRRERVG